MDALHKRSLNKQLRNGSLSIRMIESEPFLLNQIADIYKIDKSLVITTLKLIFECNYPERFVLTYLNKVDHNNFEYNLEMFNEYYLYKQTNPYDSMSDTYYSLRYGIFKDYYKNRDITTKKSFYDPAYVADRDNISISEAEIKINKLKSDKATNLKGFINRYGEIEGTLRFEKFQSSSKHVKENYSEQEWLNYIEIKRLTSNRSVEYWISKGFNLEDARKELVNFQKSHSPIYKEYWISNGLSEEEAINKVINLYSDCKKRSTPFKKPSKESLKIFEPIYQLLKDRGLEARYGLNSEYYITYIDDNGKLRYYLYDFTIIEYKIIIEYHGEKYHPNPNKDLTNWTQLKTGRSAEHCLRHDQHKKDVAISNGFKYLEVWSSTKFSDNINIIKEFLQKYI